MSKEHRTARESLSLAGKMAARISALLCALLMLCVLPLLFHNAFFDINRFKVQAVRTLVPPLSAVFVLGRLLEGRPSGKGRGQAGRGVTLCVLLLVLACVLACARTGFEESTLTGSNGRYCGLLFMLCCAAAYGVIAYGLRDMRPLLPLIMLCSALCAGLGVLNAMGIDPLGFYTDIRSGQEQIFLSTIGHLDFFGTYLVMVLPISAATAVFSARTGMRRYAAVCAVIVMLGATSSRTDSAFAGVHLVCFLLLALSGGLWQHISRALALWSAAFASQSAVRRLLLLSPYGPTFDGLPRYLADSGAALALAVLLLAAALGCLLAKRRGMCAPGRRRLALLALALLLIAAAVLGAAVFYFNSIDTQTPLGELDHVLRLSDSWGSYRGFVYARTMRAFADYSWADKLFGKGMEQTLAILTPYCEASITAQIGVYNDPHCQPLQFLLTCGIFGAASFLALYAVSLLSVARHMGRHLPLTALFVSLSAYSIVMLLNVTQPILIGTYFSLIALTVACARQQGIPENRQKNDKEGALRES